MDTFPPPGPFSSLPRHTLTASAYPIISHNFADPTNPVLQTVQHPTDPVLQTVPIVVEPDSPNDISHSAANPTPNLTSGGAANPHHPPYAEMISLAIEALKEKDGSSKRAIAKYIEQSFIGLPPNHSALLSHHLKRLKNSGHLIMVKKSYKIQKGIPVPLSPAPAAAATQSQTFPTSGTPRSRGRPPKPKPDPNAQPNVQPILQPDTQPTAQPFLQPTVEAFPLNSILFNGQATDPAQFNGQSSAQSNPQPVFVALGLADEPSSAVSKKRPGRPRKIMAVGGGGVAQGGGAPGFVKKGRGRPPGAKAKLVGTRLSKKGPGRPRKPKSILGPNMGPKRGPGRPSKADPKTMVIPYEVTNVPVGVVDQNSIPGVIDMTPKPRGRPRKGTGLAGNSSASGGILSSKRRGRPPKVFGAVSYIRKSTGRSVGRPRKIAQALQASSGASDALIAANGDLKRKLDYFQTKVKQAVGMLKPQLTHDSSATAIAAVQELDELASMDLNAPLREEVQPPVVQT